MTFKLGERGVIMGKTPTATAIAYGLLQTAIVFCGSLFQWERAATFGLSYFLVGILSIYSALTWVGSEKDRWIAFLVGIVGLALGAFIGPWKTYVIAFIKPDGPGDWLCSLFGIALLAFGLLLKFSPGISATWYYFDDKEEASLHKSWWGWCLVGILFVAIAFVT